MRDAHKIQHNLAYSDVWKNMVFCLCNVRTRRQTHAMDWCQLPRTFGKSLYKCARCAPTVPPERVGRCSFCQPEFRLLSFLIGALQFSLSKTSPLLNPKKHEAKKIVVAQDFYPARLTVDRIITLYSRITRLQLE